MGDQRVRARRSAASCSSAGAAADLLGRRRIFLAGIVVFTLASLFAGLAWSEASLIARARSRGSARRSSRRRRCRSSRRRSAEGRERNIALGVWGAVGGFGAAAGVLLGGVLTDALSWEWIFFVNVPVGVTAFILAPFLLSESRDASVKSFDVARRGARDGRAVVARLRDHAGGPGRLARGRDDRLLRGVARDARRLRRVGAPPPGAAHAHRHPADQDRRAAPTSPGFIMGTAMFAMFLMLTLYMQQVLGYSAMKTGVAYLAVAGTAIFTLGDRRAARDAHRREAGAR